MNITLTKRLHLLTLVLAWVYFFASNSRATDLTDPKNASILGQWGYLNVVAYGADPTGKRDSTKEIQQAIDDGAAQAKAVLVPLGTYLISDTLRCYKWWVKGGRFPSEAHLLIGENRDGKRPLVKLADSAAKFDDGEHPCPMIAFAMFKVQAKESIIRDVNPFDVPLGGSSPRVFPVKSFDLAPPDLFDEILQGINFDCSGHPGAVGVFFPAAQKSLLLDVDVNAEGAHTGIHGIPGRNSGAANISVKGGRFGLVIHSHEAGAVVVGLSLSGQTERALVCTDFVPACVVGFRIVKQSAPAITLKPSASTATGTLVLIDGSIETEDRGLLIDNRAGKAVYVRNVYARGPGSFIASGKLPPIGGTGSWFRVAEYCYTDQNEPKNVVPKLNDKSFRMYSLINGKLDREAQPVVAVENNVPSPVDYARKHLYANLPQISFRDSSKTINVMESPYDARPDQSDNWERIQRAINDAAKDGRIVYVPNGTFLISKTLELGAKTTLLGLGCKRNGRMALTAIAAHPSWDKNQSPALMRTVDDPDAETYLGGMDLVTSDKVKQHLHWRAGRKSTFMNLGFHGATSESTIYFSGHGGGRHYLVEPQSPAGTREHRHVRMVGTAQPLSWYGCNLEAGGKVAANMEMVDSRNIRIYGIKREGKSPTVIINHCANVGIFAQGAMRQGVPVGSGGYNQIRSNSDGILMALVLTQLIDFIEPNGEATLTESLDGQPSVSVNWPEGISLYKRGELNDTRMYLCP